MQHISDHKARLRAYFDGPGFARWMAIYGEGELSRVRRTIRRGHSRMLAHVERWLAERMPLPGTVLDAGCGTGLLTLTLAQHGHYVTAIDLAPQMAAATQQAVTAAGVAAQVRCLAGDIDQLDGRFDAVVCLDVLVHYPAVAFSRMLRNLAERSNGPLIFTYAPHEPLLAALHWIGAHFPAASRRTEIQLIRAAQVRSDLAAVGMQISRTADIRSGFYHVTVVEAQPF
ncbi:MAG TPA: magnesium protoporphyrin IX methyltransferase [Roseiflexaceae bacterium]|nr:magnesium protoporphyrin IX methyltransferase [Roseiflexaceae bacterium]HMP39183.1 magnesium protoporphyrin IX methyltransferase [Roseiflexaceae bacterium]